MTVEAIPLRKAARSVRRQQLIDATIAVLARKGYAALTVADVAREAGLSPGIVIFHFRSKNELLADTLGFLAKECRANWTACKKAASPEPAAQLQAMLLADFDPAVFTRQKLAAWIAFWGETQGRPVYDQLCSGIDVERLTTMQEQCRAINSEGGYGLDCYLVTRSLESLGDGLWLGLARDAPERSPYDAADEACKIMLATLAGFFPRHYQLD